MQLLQQFESLWYAVSVPPDVFAFLGQNRNADPKVILAVLLADQQHRWLTDAPLTVEDYLAGLPNLPKHLDWKLQLAIGEFEARRETRRPLSQEEISSRFPEFSETLRDRLRKLGSGEQAAPSQSSPGPDESAVDLAVGSAVDPVEIDAILPTVIKSQNSPSSTVTYITGNAIGVEQKGRYRLDRVLGEGAFGRVYLGFDEELHRQVAIKVPTKARFQKPEDAEAYLAEARTVASLDHPHIVPVYDMGRTQDGSIYVISKFIEGSTLEDRIKAGRLSERESVQLLATVALALQHAHDRRLIHRDIKPANILLEDKSSAPYVADFGLAIREEDYLKQNAIAGTPAYMSPEQIRGEGHRLDGRSDLFSLGVILYELLTGKKPFRGSSTQETLHLVLTQDPRPPRELLDSIPAELERICLKALSKRASDRYTTAAEFADDLSQWLKPAAAVTQAKAMVQVVPKGLRSFDANDADFFLDLLPGQRNREGLPESIAFWKQRIEQTDPEQTFSVGLIYGPSGCGKSSLVKAGLLPHLSDSVIAVYVEATPDETELRILRGLKKHPVGWAFLPDTTHAIPDAQAVPATRVLNVSSAIPDNKATGRNAHATENATGRNAHPTANSTGGNAHPTGLAATLLHLRLNSPQKIVIIIDQFEQWLHAHRAEPEAELVKALRQCDGGRVQVIVMIRDDFAMAAARFMQALDVAIVQGHNFATVDLFEVDHAKNVLIKFGQSFGKLPANSGNLSSDERQFVDSVANGLAQGGKVVSVRLSLFAEMVKAKRWTSETLQAVGGTEGIGVNFLEETFSSPQANPRHRLHATAARAVLKSLLPELGTDIKGHMRSQQELLDVSGYSDRPTDFTDLLRILDGELRLITPTEGGELGSGEWGVGNGGRPQKTDPTANSPFPTPRFYQLTHDYLVPSLREWLTRKQRETRKGRAELKLEERTALWTAKPENRFLPSLWEYVSIRTLTQSKGWTASQRTMMKRAGRLHSLRSGMIAGLFAVLLIAGLNINTAVKDRQNQAEATRLVEGLLAANTAQVNLSLVSLKEFRTWADPQLKQAFQESSDDSDAKLHAGLALVAEGQTVDPAVLEFLQQRLLTVTPAQFASVRELLAPHKATLTRVYWSLATDDQQPIQRRFRAACALAAFDPTNPSWNDSSFATLLSEQLVAVSPEYIGEFKELLRPVAPDLVPALGEIFKDPGRGELAKTLATSLLADYASQNPDTLTELVLAADPASDKSLFPVLQQHQTVAVRNLEAVLEQRLAPDWKDAPLDPAWTEPSAAVRAQIESAHGMITDRFTFCQDMPLSTFLEVAESLRGSGYRPVKVRPVGGSGEWAVGSGKRGGESQEGGSDDSVAIAQRDSPVPTPHSPMPAANSALPIAHSPLPLISAIWTRDSRRWHIDPNLSKADLPTPDDAAIKDGLLLSDIAPLPLTTEATELQFIALWSEPASDEEQCRVLLDVTEAELTTAQAAFPQQGFSSQCTISVRTDAIGQRRYTGSWSNQGAPSETRSAYAGFELVHMPQWDVAVAPVAKLADPLETFRQQLAQIEKLPAEKLDDPQVREARAAAQYQLGNLEQALADLDFLISKEIATANVLQYRTLTLARLGKADDARESVAKYLATDAASSYRHYVQIQVPAWLGEIEQASAELESAVTAVGQNTDDLYNVVCAAALSAQALSAKDAAQSAKFADRTFELLRQMVAQGYNKADQLKSDADFASLHADPRFIELLSQLEPPATFAALWRADVEVESKLLSGVPVDSLTEQLKPLIAEGWRPFAIAIETQQGTQEGELTPTARQATGDIAVAATCSLVLHRPLIPDAAKESLALNQAAAATALLRLNAPERVWPLFQDQPDPRVRSYVLHRLAQYGVDPQSVFMQLQRESAPPRQRSLILGIGEFARAKLLSPEQTAAVIADLAKRYADDPDSGIHGAAEWTLRQLGADATIDEIKAAYSTGEAVGNRRWYVTKTGRKTSSSGPPSPASSLCFAILTADDVFLMGSPVSESERYGGPTGKLETRRRRLIGRRFAIGAHEITVAQFRAFRSNHNFDRTKAREGDSPANMITWYDAAAYCNWLSEQEGIPRDQWCYDPSKPFAEGMSLLPDYLQRTGYRLPSEAEWEYACRAGTTTARYFGETETLLGEYAWYTKTSGDKWMLPVGMLRPNGAGLFDMQGNVLEWCQDQALYFDTDFTMMGDKGQMGSVDNSSTRVLRGGSFYDYASTVRSASRGTYQPDDLGDTVGFRVGRTLPPVPLTALSPAEGGKKSGN